MTAPTSPLPSASDQHSYPPQAASGSRSHSQHHTLPASFHDTDTISFIVHTETGGISDLRLQVSHEPSSASSKQPLRPVYFRQRELTERNEIVDKVIDASTGRVCWTVHRPTRGWYLYLRSPALPHGTAISIRSGKSKDENDPTASPLTFSVNTRLHNEALSHVRPRISDTSSCSSATGKQRAQNSSTTDESVNSANVGLAIQHAETSVDVRTEDVALAATGRENRTTSSGGHARRRSGVTGSGSHTLDPRHHPSKRPSSAAASSPMIPEIEHGQDPSPTSSSARNNSSLSRLAIPTTGNPSSASSPSSTGGDRPYSPTQPASTSSSFSLRNCTFLLTDGRPPKAQSWARWASCILPAEIRPSLSLDEDKSFSLFWTDPPGGLGSVEVLRYQDQSGRWMWNSHTRGRLTLQTSALHTIGLEQEFWISAALAYIQFLEEKDAYDAARDA